MSWNLFEKLGQSITHLGQLTVNSASDAYHASTEAVENAIKTTTSIYEDAVKSGQTGIATAIAGRQVEKFSGVIESIQRLWPQIQADLGPELKVLEEAAGYMAVAHANFTPDPSKYQFHSQAEIANATKAIAFYPGMPEILASASMLGMKSWGIGFALEIAFGVGLTGSDAIYVNIENPSKFEIVTTPELSLGLSAGGDIGAAFVLNTSTAESCDGPALAFTVEGVAYAGGGIAAEFNLPDMSFSSIVFLLKAGLDINLSGGVSYTLNIWGTAS